MNIDKDTETLHSKSANDPITGFEMDPGAEFRNLKWKGRGGAICK